MAASGKHPSNIQQTSIKNQSKIDHTPTKHESNIDLGFILEPKTVVLPFWCVLGAFCKPQEANMAASGHQDGAQIEQKSIPKLMLKIDASWMCIFAFFFDLGNQLGSKMETSWASKTYCCKV